MYGDWEPFGRYVYTWCSLIFNATVFQWHLFFSLGIVAAHTLPVFYERYEDQVDSFVYKVLQQIQDNYRKLDDGVLSKIPKGKLKGKKFE